MELSVEVTDEFEEWWDDLSESEQVDVNAKVILLQRFGPALRRPHSGAIATSRHPNMKELVTSTEDGPIGCSTPSIHAGTQFC